MPLDRLEAYLDTLPYPTIDILIECAFDEDVLAFLGLKKADE